MCTSVILRFLLRCFFWHQSYPQVLCASTEDHAAVEPLIPPEGAKIGERISFAGSVYNQFKGPFAQLAFIFCLAVLIYTHEYVSQAVRNLVSHKNNVYRTYKCNLNELMHEFSSAILGIEYCKSA
jgi:hypothetical protein